MGKVVNGRAHFFPRRLRGVRVVVVELPVELPTVWELVVVKARPGTETSVSDEDRPTETAVDFEEEVVRLAFFVMR